MKPEKTNRDFGERGTGQATRHDRLEGSVPILGTARRLVQVSLSMLNNNIPPLVQYIRRRLDFIRLPDTQLARQVIGHIRPLASLHQSADLLASHPLVTSITGRAASRSSFWWQLPNLVWLGQLQRKISTAQWPKQLDSTGETLPDMPIDILPAEAGAEILSIPDDQPTLPPGDVREPYASRTYLPAQATPVSTPSNISNPKLKGETGLSAPSGGKKQTTPSPRQAIKLVRSSVVEPDTTTGPDIKPAADRASSRQPDMIDEQPQPPPSDSQPASPVAEPPSEDTPLATTPTPLPEGMDTVDYSAAAGSIKIDAPLSPGQRIPLTSLKPLIPAKPVTRFLSQLKPLQPETSRVEKVAIPRSDIRLIQSSLSGPVSKRRPVSASTMPTSEHPAENTGQITERNVPITEAPLSPGDVAGSTPSLVSYGVDYVNITKEYHSTRPEMPLSPPLLPSPLANAEIGYPSLSLQAKGRSQQTSDSRIAKYNQITPSPAGIYRKRITQTGSLQDTYSLHQQEPGLKPAPEAAWGSATTDQVHGPSEEDVFHSGWPEASRPYLSRPATEQLPSLGLTPPATTENPASEIIQTRVHHDGQSAPELALAPASRSEPAETGSLSSQIETAAPAEATTETKPPDIDAIARDVYRLLKRRLAREKERALGLS